MGYIPAYFIWMTRFRHKWLLLLLLIVPFWISFTIRTFSWIHILGEQGVINVTLMSLGIIDEPIQMLYTEGAVIMGMIHFLLPYMILNVYVSLEGIDRDLDLRGAHAGLHQRAGLPRSDPAAVAARACAPGCCCASCWRPAAMSRRRSSAAAATRCSAT